MKKFIGLFTAITLLFVTSCTNNEVNTTTDRPEESAKKEIHFWTMALSPTFDDYINNLVEEYESNNEGIDVVWTDVPWDEMETKILTAYAGGTAPDVVNLNPQFASKLAVEGALINPETYMNNGEDKLYFEGIYNSSSYNNQTFALPWYITNVITIYNTNLYEQAGVEALTNYNDLLEISRAIKESPGKYGFYPTFDGSSYLESVARIGIPMVRDGKAAFNTPEMVEYVQLYMDLFEEKLVPTEILNGGQTKAREMFMSGELATFISGPSMLGPIKNDAPDIYNITGVAESPTGDIGYTNSAIMNLAIPNQDSDENYDNAVDFALFVTNPANQSEFCKVAGTILPSTIKSLEDEYFSGSDGTVEGEAKAIAAGQLENSKALIPPIERVTELTDIMTEEVQLAMVGDKSAEEAVKSAEERWNDVLSEIEHSIDF